MAKQGRLHNTEHSLQAPGCEVLLAGPQLGRPVPWAGGVTAGLLTTACSRETLRGDLQRGTQGSHMPGGQQLMQSRHPWREQGAPSGGPREPSGKAVATVYNLIIVGPLKTLVPPKVREVKNLIKYQFVDGGRGKREGKRNDGSTLGP